MPTTLTKQSTAIASPTASPKVIKRKLRRTAEEADELRRNARAMLIDVVADAHQLGMTQRDIAQSLGRSQPEISRLLNLSEPRFMPRSDLGRLLVRKRSEIEMAVEMVGASNIRVFGSLARGEDGPESDIDLLIDIPAGFSLFDLGRLQAEVNEIVRHPVDLIPARGLKGKIRSNALKEAVAL